MNSGMYSQNGILTYIAMNFYLVTDAWALVLGVIATSFVTFVLSILLPFSGIIGNEENSQSNYENNYIIEQLLVNNLLTLL